MARFSSGVPPWFTENSLNLAFIAFSADWILYYGPVRFQQCSRVQFLPTIFGLEIHVTSRSPNETDGLVPFAEAALRKFLQNAQGF